ncbi:MAG TPA: L-histidine N(alpha)-methyltransferase [Longimicrobiales bacterium]|nr:L-histidine N(alpha)-methyltransferase [Longimicrobiales bacterium]
MMEAERELMRVDVARGLGLEQKELSPKYFYDARGSELFDRITELPEYYLTRAERALLAAFVKPWLVQTGARSIVELGAGSGDKTHLLLGALPAGGVYVPVDISRSYLEQIADELRPAFPALRIVPAHADITSELPLPNDVERPLVVAFIGSTIGNFSDAMAAALLRRVHDVLGPADRLLLGVDLRKDAAKLNAAYNDSAGVTAEFNLNVLHVINRELDADFDTDAFRHRAFYDERLGRVEMHLVSTRAQTVSIPEVGEFTFARDETIRTEISSKFDRPGVEQVLARAGLELGEWWEGNGYALLTAGPRVAGNG